MPTGPGDCFPRYFCGTCAIPQLWGLDHKAGDPVSKKVSLIRRLIGPDTVKLLGAISRHNNQPDTLVPCF
jgi:hypothetical protein